MEMNAINNLKTYDAFYKTDRARVADKKGSPTKNKDSVALSDNARLYNAASAALNKVPDIREDRIMQIKAMMDKDKYNVSSAQLADKILSPL